MSTLLGLFRKQPKASPVISRPILFYTDSFDSSYPGNEKDDNDLGKPHHKDALPPRPRKPPPNRRLLIFIYITTSLFSLTSIVLFSIAIPLWNKNFIHRQSPIKTDWPDTLILVPLTLSVFSSTYLLTTSLHRRRQSNPPDPFNLIILSSTLILSLIPALILVSNNTLAHAFSDTNIKPTSPNPSGTTNSTQTCNLINILTRPCLPILYFIGELQLSGIALASFVALTWLIVFLLSTRNLIRKRVEERRRKEDRRKRRHARRRGHEQKSTRKHGRGDGSHGSRNHDGARGGENLGGTANESSRRSDESRGRVTLPAPWEGSNAVQYAQQKVKPNESIQRWLADRPV